jgi:hypothetical protein
MEDCPICFEPMTSSYNLDNCQHTICWDCSRKCKEQSTENCIDVHCNFPVYIKNGNPIKCPMCRTVEMKMSVDVFKHYDPDSYNEWIQLELHCDEYGESFYYSEDTPIKKTLFPRRYQRIPKRVVWKKQRKSFKF